MARKKRKSQRAVVPYRKPRRPLKLVLPRGLLTAKYVLARMPHPIPIAKQRLPRRLSTIPEKRPYHPERHRLPPTVSGTPSPGLRPGKKLYSLNFIRPKKITVCVRRQTRKEVLHAIGKAGQGGLGLRKKRRLNDDSKITC